MMESNGVQYLTLGNQTKENMKAINFKEINLKMQLNSDETVQLDIRESFANVMYQKMCGIAALNLAQKIFNSDGEVEYNDNEVALILECANSFCIPAVIEALNSL